MRYLITLFLLFTFFDVTAQSGFMPVEIELKTGVVEKGFIEKTNLSKTPKTFTVYPEQTRNNAKTYSPAEVKTFTITNFGSYIGVMVTRYIHELTTARLSTVSQEEAILSEPIFLLTLIKGSKLNLYSHNLGGRYNFFIQEGNGDLKALRYLRSISSDGRFKVSEYRYYMQQLLPYVSGNDDLVARLETLDWRESQMIKFIKAVNNNTVAYAPYKGQRSEPNSAFFISAGAAISFRKFTTKFSFENSLDRIQFPISFSPVISLGYETRIGTQSNRFIFQPALSVFYFQSNGTNNFKDAAGVNVTSRYDIKGFSIFAGAALKYQITKKIKAGVGGNLHIDLLTESRFVSNLPTEQIVNKTPIWVNGFVQADYSLTSKQGITIAFSPMQKILNGSQDVWLKSGYGFIAYTYYFGKKE
jgi:hypothetical protein